MNNLMLILSLLFSSAMLAQNAMPAGTILPVRLNASLKSEKSKPRQVISARLMQDVPLPGGSTLHAGAKILGRVVSVENPTNDGRSAKIVLRFDEIRAGSHRIPITTNLRALASMMEVNEAQIPDSGPDRGTSEFTWTTRQIGGEADYHGYTIYNGSQLVGKSIAPNGALVQVSSRTGTTCHSDEGTRRQAVWVFASDACGLYGYPNLALAHAGRTDPIGEIALVSNHGDLNIRAGSGMLLRVR